MEFEWDEKKALLNQLKHRLSFEGAITAFDDPMALVASDAKHSSQERREWLIGEMDAKEEVVVVVFTKRGNTCRIISARPANRKERKQYEFYKRIPF